MDGKVVDINEFRRRREQSKLKKDAGKIEKKADKRNRMKIPDFLLMLAVAIFFDVVQGGLTAIPFVGWALSPLVTIFAWLTFYLWTSIKGWGLSDTLKQFIVSKVIPLIEIVPILNAIPAWSLKVVLTYVFLKAEDTLYNVSGGRADAEKLAQIYDEAA